MNAVEVGSGEISLEPEKSGAAMNLVATFVLTGLFVCVLCGAAFGAVVTLLFGPSSDVLVISTGCAVGLFTALVMGRLCLALLNETITMVRAANFTSPHPDPRQNHETSVILDLTDVRMS